VNDQPITLTDLIFKDIDIVDSDMSVLPVF